MAPDDLRILSPDYNAPSIVFAKPLDKGRTLGSLGVMEQQRSGGTVRGECLQHFESEVGVSKLIDVPLGNEPLRA